MQDSLFLAGLAAAFLALPGCADDISATSGPDAPPPSGDAAASRVTTVRNADGTYTTRVDATSTTDWTVVDLSTGAETTGPWDIACQRFHIKLDGGVSGDAGVEVAPIPAASLDAVTAVATTGWITDAADGDGDGNPDYAFEQGDGWYAYDATTHVLTPRPVIWQVRLRGGAVVKLRIDDYYDAAGTAGSFAFHWAPLAAAGVAP